MLHETHEARPSETLTRVPYWVFQTAETYRRSRSGFSGAVMALPGA